MVSGHHILERSSTHARDEQTIAASTLLARNGRQNDIKYDKQGMHNNVIDGPCTYRLRFDAHIADGPTSAECSVPANVDIRFDYFIVILLTRRAVPKSNDVTHRIMRARQAEERVLAVQAGMG